MSSRELLIAADGRVRETYGRKDGERGRETGRQREARQTERQRQIPRMEEGQQTAHGEGELERDRQRKSCD